jgi:tight adherence protein B
VNIEFLIAMLTFSTLLGVFVTRRVRAERQKKQISYRLSSLLESEQESAPVTIVRSASPRIRSGFRIISRFLDRIEILLLQAGYPISISECFLICTALFVVPLLVAVFYPSYVAGALLVGLVMSGAPILLLVIQKARLRRRFIEQLPDAIDLMISVLRTGHSIPQAVKTVGEEAPDPCGNEFNAVLQRMNLGQPLTESLQFSCSKYESYELDLIRKAIAIQSEVGGSLAELLEKTNNTLKQRLKLVRHVRVLTAQSRLTGSIVGLLPIFIAVVLQAIHPGYLNPLFETSLGRTLLMVAVCLQLFGLFLLKRISTVKV